MSTKIRNSSSSIVFSSSFEKLNQNALTWGFGYFRFRFLNYTVKNSIKTSFRGFSNKLFLTKAMDDLAIMNINFLKGNYKPVSSYSSESIYELLTKVSTLNRNGLLYFDYTTLPVIITLDVALPIFIQFCFFIII